MFTSTTVLQKYCEQLFAWRCPVSYGLLLHNKRYPPLPVLSFGSTHIPLAASLGHSISETKTREVTTVPPASLPPERGKRNTVNDCCPVTLYSTGNMATQIVYRQWNGQSVFLCKINRLVVYT